MQPIEKIRQTIFSIQPLTDEEWKKHEESLTPAKFRKGEFLIKAGQIETNMYYLAKGLCRNYFVSNEREFTVDFHFEGDFVTGFYSLITGAPSPVNIVFLEDSDVLILPIKQIQEFYAESININRLGRRMAEFHYIKRLEKEMELLSLTAEERYAKLLNRKPEFVRAISVKHLSSYLGIQPESLSRIRKSFSA